MKMYSILFAALAAMAMTACAPKHSGSQLSLDDAIEAERRQLTEAPKAMLDNITEIHIEEHNNLVQISIYRKGIPNTHTWRVALDGETGFVPMSGKLLQEKTGNTAQLKIIKRGQAMVLKLQNTDLDLANIPGVLDWFKKDFPTKTETLDLLLEKTGNSWTASSLQDGKVAPILIPIEYYKSNPYIETQEIVTVVDFESEELAEQESAQVQSDERYLRSIKDVSAVVENDEVNVTVRNRFFSQKWTVPTSNIEVNGDFVDMKRSDSMRVYWSKAHSAQVKMLSDNVMMIRLTKETTKTHGSQKAGITQKVDANQIAKIILVKHIIKRVNLREDGPEILSTKEKFLILEKPVKEKTEDTDLESKTVAP